MKKKIIKIALLSVLWLGVLDSFTAGSVVRLTNIGKMYVADNQAATSLYVPESIRMSGAGVNVVQKGRTALGGDFINDITSGNVFDNSSSGWYRFCGTNAQWILGSASKQTHYINFPNVEIRNRASVSLDAQMGMSVGTLKLLEGKFVLKSVQDASMGAASQLAHLLVKNGVTYTRGAATPQQNGVVEIELYLGDNRDKRFFGWTSPYKKTYSDYLFYNFLMEPTGESLFGDLRKTIIDAEYPLIPGRGYLIGQGVYSTSIKYEWPQTQWSGAKYEDRFTNMLTFNRYTFKDILQKSIAVASSLPDSYTSEELNTEDITASLSKAGYQFLGNPYTCPLDMTNFVKPAAAGADSWRVSRGNSGTEDVYNMFWVISQGNAYNVDETNMSFSINVTYLVGQNVGSTYTLYPNLAGLQIAPMQLFVVYANRAVNLTIPKSERTQGNTPFLRSETPVIDNELLLEVTDEETKGYDRACVVFRPGASTDATDPYDASKLFNRSGGVNQIWFPTDNTPAGKKLSVSVIPYETNAMELAWMPSATPQKCTVTAYRQESLTVPERALLQDRQTGAITDLLATPSYTFQSAPTDRPDRFVLLFKSPTGIDNIKEGVLSCYYNKAGQEIVIRGVEESDAQSIITVYDTQGRSIMYRPVANGIIPFTATDGVYLVKITGKRGLNDKIAVR